MGGSCVPQDLPVEGPSPSAASEHGRLLAQGQDMKGVQHVAHRFMAPSGLIVAGITLLAGCMLVITTGVVEFLAEDGNTHIGLDRYPSGHGYFPDSAGEMVADFKSPSGRIFYTFGMIAALFLFVSMYPFHLRNVYTGHDEVPLIGVYWTTLRQMVIPMGIMLMIGVNTFPFAIAMNSKGYMKLVCKMLHMVGGAMVMVTFIVCESKCLGLLGCPARDDHPKVKPAERRMRTLLVGGTIFFCLCFAVVQALLGFEKRQGGICCADQWAFKGETIPVGNRHVTVRRAAELVDTASGGYLALKVTSFVLDCAITICAACSHVAIWFFCEERGHHHGFYTLRKTLGDERTA